MTDTDGCRKKRTSGIRNNLTHRLDWDIFPVADGSQWAVVTPSEVIADEGLRWEAVEMTSRALLPASE